MTTTHTNNHQSDRKRRIFVIAFLILLGLAAAITSDAQNHYTRNTKVYRGFSGSFGVRTSKYSSNIAELNNAYAEQTGGQIGLVAGNDVWKVRLGILGYYSLTSGFAGQVDLYENNVLANFYPLGLVMQKKTKFNPYLVGGLSSGLAKLHGHYASRDGGPVNYSSFDAPYIGSIHSVRSVIGAGVDFKIIDDFDFVHLFTEVTYGMNLLQTTKSEVLEGTRTNNQMAVNVGLRFGSHRKKSNH